MQASLEPAEPVSARALPDWVNALRGSNEPFGVVEDLLTERADAGRA